MPREASQKQIKSAYRRLAFRFHPDKNTNYSDNQRFIEIDEAYKVLSNPDSRRDYDYRLQVYEYRLQRLAELGREPKSTAQDSHSPAYHHPPYQTTAATAKSQTAHRQWLIRYVLLARWVCFAASVFCNLLFIDYFLPGQEKYAEVTQRKRAIVSGRVDILQTTEGSFPIAHDFYPEIVRAGYPVYITVSPVFNTVKDSHLVVVDFDRKVYPFYSLYTVFSFILFVLFLCSNIALIVHRDHESIVNLAYICAIFSFFVIFILFITH